MFYKHLLFSLVRVHVYLRQYLYFHRKDYIKAPEVSFDNVSDKSCPNFSESIDLILRSDTFFLAVGV